MNTLRNLVLLLPALLIPLTLHAEDCLKADELYNQSLKAEAGKMDKLAQAIQLCPSHLQAVNNLAVLKEGAGKLDEATELYQKAIKLQTDFAPAHAGLGDVRMAKSDFRGAAAAYKTFLDLMETERMEGRQSPLFAHVPIYKERLTDVQRKIDTKQVVSANEIAGSLSSPEISTRNKRGIRNVMKKPQVDLNINFAKNSDEVTGDSMQQLENVAQALKNNSLTNSKIVIEGHTDADGGADYNKSLSERRAQKVREILTARYGIPPTRLEIVGRGMSAPVASNQEEFGKALNRRVTFINSGVVQ